MIETTEHQNYGIGEGSENGQFVFNQQQQNNHFGGAQSAANYHHQSDFFTDKNGILQHPGQSEKFQIMCKTEMCRNWENGYCQYGNKVSPQSLFLIV